MKLVLLDKNEVNKGEKEEAGEHGFDPQTAHKTAMDHLTQKNPHYYSILQKLGLEDMIREWIDSVFTKDKVGTRLGRARKELKKHKGNATIVGDTGLAGGQH